MSVPEQHCVSGRVKTEWHVIHAEAFEKGAEGSDAVFDLIDAKLPRSDSIGDERIILWTKCESAIWH